MILIDRKCNIVYKFARKLFLDEKYFKVKNCKMWFTLKADFFRLGVVQLYEVSRQM